MILPYRTEPPIEVWAGHDDTPERFRWRRRIQHVAAIEETWVLAGEWWEDRARRVDRRYYRVRTEAGLACILYRNNVTRVWHMERVYD